MKRGKLYTSALYRFEGDKLLWPDKWYKKRTSPELERWIHSRFQLYSPRSTKYSRLPIVRLGKGILHDGVRWAYYDPNDHSIEFSASQCNLITALHEIVHSFGFGFHNKLYVDSYFDLLYKEGFPMYWCLEQREKYLLT